MKTDELLKESTTHAVYCPKCGTKQDITLKDENVIQCIGQMYDEKRNRSYQCGNKFKVKVLDWKPLHCKYVE